MAHLSLKGIEKIYPNGFAAVKNVNLEIEDKEFMVITGPTECGKSVLIRMMAGLEEISSGELYIDNKRVTHVNAKDRDVAMVFQNYSLYPNMGVFENIAFGLRLQNFGNAEVEKRVKEVAGILDIEHLLDAGTEELSKEQELRIVLGRALVRNPKVYLMDEPFENLDEKLKKQLRNEILDLHRRLQTTIIYATSDRDEAMALGDRIAVMKDGGMQQVDTPENLSERPNSPFVAGFINSAHMQFSE